jgi:hypothetical protein
VARLHMPWYPNPPPSRRARWWNDWFSRNSSPAAQGEAKECERPVRERREVFISSTESNRQVSEMSSRTLVSLLYASCLASTP